MKLTSTLLTVYLFLGSAFAQSAPTAVTVPVTLDHNRIIIDVRLRLPDDSTTRVRAWVDTASPDLWITERLATKLGLELSGTAKDSMGFKERASQPPRELLIGGMPVPLDDIKQARAVIDRSAIFPGLSAQISLPATVLRNYDVVVDYPNRELTLAARGTVHFEGTRAKAMLGPQNGLIQLSGSIAGRDYSFGLDLGSSFTIMSSDLVAKLRQAHPQWPQLTGAISTANLWGLEDEPRWDLLRVPTMKFGGITLAGLGAAACGKEYMNWLEQRAGAKAIGFMGANALLDYRVGIDYAHAAVFFLRTAKASAPDMDVIGLTLRPEPDRRYTVIGIAKYQGKPSVPKTQPGDVLVAIDQVPAAGGTMGQVWSLLGGRPGDVRILTLERGGKQFTVKATVRRFLSAASTQTKPAKTQAH